MHENRSTKRFDLKLKARVALKSNCKDRNWYDGVTSSISSSGAFLLTREAFPIGSRVDFEAVLPLRDKDSKVNDSLVKMSGVVTRTEEAGMAICFDDIYTILPFPKPVLH